jgi:hypothetical protein
MSNFQYRERNLVCKSKQPCSFYLRSSNSLKCTGYFSHLPSKSAIKHKAKARINIRDKTNYQKHEIHAWKPSSYNFFVSNRDMISETSSVLGVIMLNYFINMHLVATNWYQRFHVTIYLQFKPVAAFYMWVYDGMEVSGDEFKAARNLLASFFFFCPFYRPILNRRNGSDDFLYTWSGQIHSTIVSNSLWSSRARTGLPA